MALTPESVRTYLDRVAYRGGLEPDLNTLWALHLSHLLTVPFENLDIHLGRKIVIDVDRFFDKIVKRRRGGFCYELNGLFAALLAELGFDVTLLSARVSNGTGGFGAEYDHLTLLVELEEPWLADVGFGDSFRRPLRLNSREAQPDGRDDYRIERRGDSLILSRRKAQKDWEDEYAFTLTPRRLEEFEAMCGYHQTSPQSSFTQKRVCSIATAAGRISLSEMRLIVTEGDNRREEVLAGDSEYEKTLRELFGIDLSLEQDSKG